MKKGTLLGDAVILFVITLLAGTLLGGVYQITKQPIADAEAKAVQEAYTAVFPEAASFEENAELSGNIDDGKIYAEDSSMEGVFIKEVLEAKDESGAALGYVMTFGTKKSYGGELTLSMGVDATGTITGFEVLTCNDTAGLGANCKTDGFKSQFKGIQSGTVNYTKNGDGSPENATIDALSGATITTKAITQSVNNALGFIYAYCDIQG